LAIDGKIVKIKIENDAKIAKLKKKAKTS